MLLHLDFEVDNPSEAEISIKKLFQVIFLGRIQANNSRQVDVYTALLVCKEQSDFLRCNLKQTLNGLDPQSIKDARTLFSNDEILKQFWGPETTGINRIEDTFDHLPGTRREQVGSVLAQYWPSIDVGACPILVHERARNIGPLLVLPLAASITENKVILDLQKGPPIGLLQSSGVDLASGVWIHSRFTAPVESIHTNLEFEHHLNCRSPVRIEELRVYYCCPPGCDIVDQNGHVFTAASRSAAQHTEETHAELYKVYSQSRTKYFDDWLHLGILRGTLLRIQLGATLEAKLSSQFLHGFAFQFRATDLDAVRRNEARILITSIWLAALMAVGVDHTRLETARKLLPSTGQLTATFWWLLMCGTLVPLLFKGMSTHLRKFRLVAAVICILAFCCWFALAFFLDPTLQQKLRLEKWLVYVPPLVVFSGLTVLVFHLVERHRISVS